VGANSVAAGNSRSYACAMSDLAQRLGEVLRGEREARNLSQERLAELASLDRTAVQRLERGLYSMRLDTLERIARALQTYPSELLALADGSEDETSEDSED
jgi:transcriptional regulator with XRE-family HTH domain